MIPKIIHLLWFGGGDYPVEIKVCLDSWKRLLPDYELRVWTYDDAKAIGCAYIDEALANRKWAFAADVVRFYAVYKYGGVYMDSDIFLKRRFDDLMELPGFVTFGENLAGKVGGYGLQAAFFMGEAGNGCCRKVLDYYDSCHFVKEDGTFDETISPFILREAALSLGYCDNDAEMHSHGEGKDMLTVLPTFYVSPRNKYNHHPEAIGEHRIYGSWRKRKFGRKMELLLKHFVNVVKYALLHR